MQATRAILIRKVRLTESSLIVTWLTEQHGKLRTVAKGARSPKGRAGAGAVDLFFKCEIAVLASRKSELHTLRESRVQETFENVRFDYARLRAASYFAELLDLATELEHPVPELFDLMDRALGYLQDHSPTRRAILHFENELARLLGIREEGSAAVEALAHAFHHLPEARPGLLNDLPT